MALTAPSLPSSSLAAPSIVRARVRHVRRVPAHHRFAYGVDYLLLDEAMLAGTPRARLFSFGRANLVSLQPSDHGVAHCRGVQGVRMAAKRAGIEGIARVLLLAQPRYWGYTFNPVSFWFCLSAAGGLRAVLAEVHNTFGDRHIYLCANDNGRDIGAQQWLEAAKCFHVSPFFDIVGRYRFRFLLDDARLAVQILYEDGAGGGLATSLVGHRHPFTDGELLRTLVRRPLGAARTSAAIHWQAVRLWLKRVRHWRRPPPPPQSIT